MYYIASVVVTCFGLEAIFLILLLLPVPLLLIIIMQDNCQVFHKRCREWYKMYYLLGQHMYAPFTSIRFYEILSLIFHYDLCE